MRVSRTGKCYKVAARMIAMAINPPSATLIYIGFKKKLV
jgi:hypothetical protein